MPWHTEVFTWSMAVKANGGFCFHRAHLAGVERAEHDEVSASEQNQEGISLFLYLCYNETLAFLHLKREWTPFCINEMRERETSTKD